MINTVVNSSLDDIRAADVKKINDFNKEVKELNTEQKQAKAKSKEDEALFSLLHNFDTHKKVDPIELIGGIFPRKYLTILAGAPGTGKSNLILRMITDLSKGGQIFGGLAENEAPRRILVFVGELGEDGLIDRAQKFGIHGNKDNIFSITSSDADEMGISLMLQTNEGQENITKLVERVKPDIVIFDSVISFFNGDEKDNKDIGRAIKFLASIAKKFNCATVATHHNRKRLSSERKNPLTLDDVIGGSAISRLACVVAAVEQDDIINAVRCRCLKSWIKKFKDFSFQVKEGIYSNTLDYIINVDIPSKPDLVKEQEKQIKEVTTPDYVKMYLKGKGNSGGTVEEIFTALKNSNTLNLEDNENSRSNIKMVLSRLVKSKEIIRLKRGLYALPEIDTGETLETDKNENENTNFECDNSNSEK